METAITKSNENKPATFIERGIETLEGAITVAEFLADSKIIPFHFYEKLPDGKPDFSKGKIGAIAGVLVHGIGTLKLPAMTALQNIIPVNGLLSIKGDLAKSMIFSSGLLRKDSWKETVTGSIEEENMEVTITATRDDNGLTLSKSFSINDAKRAGLWITSQQVNGSDGWKYKTSPWWKYQKRMLYYRPLGYLARDLFGDVMNNMYTTEEAMDLPVDQGIVIDQGNGVTLQIPDKQHAQARTEKMTGRAIDKIEGKNFAPVDPPQKPAAPPVQQQQVRQEVHHQDAGEIVTGDGCGNNTQADEGGRETLSIKAMEGMDTAQLLEIVNGNSDMIEAMMAIPGKNTHKKLREIIFAHNEKFLAEHIKASTKEEDPEPGDGGEDQGNNEPPNDPPAGDAAPVDNELIPAESKDLNKYRMTIPPFNKGNERDFVSMKELFSAMSKLNPPINNERYLELTRDTPEFNKYFNKEEFAKYATIEEVCSLLNKN